MLQKLLTRYPKTVLATVSMLVFCQSFWFEFVSWDDNQNLLENPFFKPVSWTNLWALWTAPFYKLYIPVSYTGWIIIAKIAGWVTGNDAGFALNPAAFHFASVAFHVLNVLLVWKLMHVLLQAVRQQVESKRPDTRFDEGAVDLAAMAGACVFAFHPVQVETVSWVSTFRDVLGTFLGLSAMFLFWRSRWIGACVLFTLALLSKPSFVVIPAVTWIFSVAFLKREWKKELLLLSPWFAIGVGVTGLTMVVQSSTDFQYIAPLWQRPFIMMDSLAFYLRKMVFPHPLYPDYGHSPLRVIKEGYLYLTWILPAAFMGGILYFHKARRMEWAAAFALFIGALAPVLGLVPFNYQNISTVADRYLYFPMIVAAGGVTLAFARMGRNVRVGIALLLVAFAAKSVTQVRVWETSQTLAEHALEGNPESFAFHNNMGLIRMSQGGYQDALKHYARAIELNPQPEVFLNYGIVLYYLNRKDEAIQHYQKALQLIPRFAEMRANLATMLWEKGEHDAAIEALRQAVQDKPEYWEGHYKLAQALAMKGRLAESKAALEEILRLNPSWERARSTLDEVQRKIASQ